MLCAKYLDGGKSTIWFLPLSSMHEQYEGRFKEQNVTCETWSYETSSESPPLHILATIETTDASIFHNYVVILVTFGRLGRIIMDEAHLALLHDCFRSVMHTLKWLGQQNIQITILSATLPPSLEEDMFKALGITTYKICRTRTARPDISYNVLRADNINDRLDQLFHEIMAKSDSGSCLIFCLSRQDAEETGKRLNIRYCHSGMPTVEVAANVAGLRRGDYRAMASTSLLSVSLDVGSVSHTIHLDYPRNVLDYLQGTGRAAREQGKIGWSYVIVPKIKG